MIDSTSDMSRSRTVHGAIRRRLLVNALVDPEEAAPRLPPGVRPHVTEQGTVVGCCLLELADVRPAGLPAAVGVDIRAAANRISAEWEDAEGRTFVGVYVPLRRTDSLLAAAAGGRVFPGVHRRVPVEVRADADTLGHRRVLPGRPGLAGHVLRVDLHVDRRGALGDLASTVDQKTRSGRLT
jgi:hypothetical protein